MRWDNTQFTSLVIADGEGGAQLSLMWRVLGALVLGVMLARWLWILFAPPPTVIAAVAERGMADETARLFGVPATGLALDGMVLTNVRLVGVFAASSGKPGFAILLLDDKRQVGVALGESVVAGTKLIEVHPEYVVLERAGVQQKVRLQGKSAADAAASIMMDVERTPEMLTPRKLQ